MTCIQQYWLPAPRQLAYRYGFETADPPLAGISITGVTRATGGVVPVERMIQRAGGTVEDAELSTACGAWYAYNGDDEGPNDARIAIANDPALQAVVASKFSFCYTAGSTVNLWWLDSEGWRLQTLPFLPLFPGPASRRNWREIALTSRGALLAVEFQGVVYDYAIDNLTFGSLDALGAL